MDELFDPKVNPRKYRYCPFCRADLIIAPHGIDKTPHLVCVHGHAVYQSSAPTASALVVEDGKLLLAKRGQEPRKGYWDTTGGFLVAGEHPEAGAIREMREELGIEVAIDRFVGVFMDVYGEEGEPTLNFYYQAHIVSGTIRVGSDIVDYRWFPLTELPELAFRNEEEAVAKLRSPLSEKKRT